MLNKIEIFIPLSQEHLRIENERMNIFYKYDSLGEFIPNSEKIVGGLNE